MLKASVLFAAVILLIGHSALATVNTACIDDLNWIASSKFSERVRLDPSDLNHNQKTIGEYAKSENLPFFEVKIHEKFVPVILLNRTTLPYWSPFLEQSMGILQSLNPGTGADHGYIRLPGGALYDSLPDVPGKLFEGLSTQATLVDLYSPEKAGRNAINGNGYRFKSMSGYFARRHYTSETNFSDVYVDLAYSLPQADQIRVWLYHAAKRISLVRIQYAFDQPNNDWIRAQRRVLQQDGNTFQDKLTGGYEQCNNCRLGGNVAVHTAEMRNRLSRLLNKDVNYVYSLPEIKQFLDDAKKDLLYRDWRDPQQYNPNFLDKTHYMDLVGPHLRSDLSHDEKVDALSYLLTVNIFEEVWSLKDRLGIIEGRPSQYGNPNISAIFIYAEKPQAVRDFYSAQFEFLGASSGNGFSHKYFETRKPYGDIWPDNWSNYVP